MTNPDTFTLEFKTIYGNLLHDLQRSLANQLMGADVSWEGA